MSALLEGLKWCGYVLAAALILSVVVGSGLLLFAIVVVVAISVGAVMLVTLIAHLLKAGIEKRPP